MIIRIGIGYGPPADPKHMNVHLHEKAPRSGMI